MPILEVEASSDDASTSNIGINFLHPTKGTLCVISGWSLMYVFTSLGISFISILEVASSVNPY